MNEKILLTKNKSKVSTNVNNSLTVQLIGSKRILPCDPLETTVSEIDVYNEEREKCTKIRLTVQVNPICSNVLFNNFTEIVRNEGTDNAVCVNFTDLENIEGWDEKSLMFREKSDFEISGSTVVNAIRDTQLSNTINGFKYHCGLDIFNNHYLRSKTFKTVCPMDTKDSKYTQDKKWFNTIFDKMRRYDSDSVMDYIDKNANKKSDYSERTPIHLYLTDEITNFKETVSTKLFEKNGWFGFTNTGKMKVYNDKNESMFNNDYDWFKVINYRKPCDFIDMYPNRELFFFDPIYNSERQRIEKNWNYCITYPSSATTDIPFIKKYQNGTTGLKVMLFDDTIKYLNGVDAIKIWSVSKHGLSEDNQINIYKSFKNESGEIEDVCILKNVKVIKVINEYVFYVYRDGIKLSNKWIELPDKITDEYNGYKISDDKTYIIDSSTNKKFYLINHKKANIDENAQNISFKRVVDGSETKYYVRIFSKLPNWKFADKKPTEKLIEEDKYKPINDSFVRKYQTTENDFDNHIGKLAFSKNIYTDNISEIVFTDDIDFGILKDNLGRPISELYLTIIKNNSGYREWYGKGGNDTNVVDPIIEYSHCFGKINCAFKLSEESYPNDEYNNVLLINNVDNTFSKNGLDITYINDSRSNVIDNDEIQYMPYDTYKGDVNFYGDLCCYSDMLCEEQSIQIVDFRFNTAQRELTNNFSSREKFNDGKLVYDEIMSDDFDENDFIEGVHYFQNSLLRKEGYYYQPHYKIPIKTYSDKLTTIYPNFLTIKQITTNERGEYRIVTMENHLVNGNTTLMLYDKINKKHYFIKLLNVNNTKSFDFKLFPNRLFRKEEEVKINITNKKDFKMFIKGEDIPEYASLLNDGSCRFVYRELYQNGFDDNADIETYPFTNGNLYVNKNINLFLRRQNPKGTNELRSKTYPYDIITNNISFEKENKYYHEEEIKC